MDIDRENISQLSDDQLFASLRKAGLNVGPITGTTRSLYEKRLRTYLENLEKGGNTIVTLSASSIVPPATEQHHTVKQHMVDNNSHAPVEIKKAAAEKPHLTENGFGGGGGRAGEPPVRRSSIRIESRVTPQPSETTEQTEYVPTSKSSITITRPSASLHTENGFAEPIPPSSQYHYTNGKSNAADHDTYIRANTFTNHQLSDDLVEFRAKIAASKTPARSSLSTTTANDKFADRLSSYGLARKDNSQDNDLTTTTLPPIVTLSSTSFSEQRRASPTTPTVISRRTAQVSLPFSPKSSSSSTKEAAKTGSSFFNWKYLIAVVILTAIVYYFLILIQENPKNPIYNH